MRGPLRSVASSPVAATIIGRYALFEEIASGGMATVYFGRLVGAAGFARQVAIKRLSERLASDAAARTMFLDEAKLGARIHHPNVVQTLDVAGYGEELLLVMEYVHGETMARLGVASRKAGFHVPIPIALAAIIDVLNGLHAAHEVRTENDEPLNIVHRDVSPQNILVGRDGVARVLDFGVARADERTTETRAGVVKGKVGYMAPEQLLGEKVTRRTDIFAAGVVLWELLTGRRLLVAGDSGDSLRVDALLNGTFDPPSRHRTSVDPALDAIVMCALDRNPAARFATASEMARTLEGVAVVATSTQVGEWVQSLAGATLAERARKLGDFERADTLRSTTAATRRGEVAGGTPARSSRAGARSSAWVAGAFAAGAALALGGAWLASHHDDRGPASLTAPDEHSDDAIRPAERTARRARAAPLEK